MEKSLLSFAATYPGWLPGPGAAELLSAVGPSPAALPLNGAFHPPNRSVPYRNPWSRHLHSTGPASTPALAVFLEPLAPSCGSSH